MDLLLVLRILSVITILSFVITLNQKKSQSNFVYAPLVLSLIFEIFFTIYHPMLGAISLVSFGILVAYFYYSRNDEKFSCFLERVGLYVMLGIFCVSMIVEAVEIVIGRFF